MNTFLKPYMNKKMRLYEFVKGLEHALNMLRNSTVAANATTRNTTVVLATKIQLLKLHCAEVYTKKHFL